jgi:hypothetical protein
MRKILEKIIAEMKTFDLDGASGIYDEQLEEAAKAVLLVVAEELIGAADPSLKDDPQ